MLLVSLACVPGTARRAAVCRRTATDKSSVAFDDPESAMLRFAPHRVWPAKGRT
jgi:hypothetical protein